MKSCYISEEKKCKAYSSKKTKIIFSSKKKNHPIILLGFSGDESKRFSKLEKFLWQFKGLKAFDNHSIRRDLQEL